MAGSPLKHERNRLVREAIFRAMRDGEDPVDYVRRMVVEPLEEMACDASQPATRLGAVRELADRIDGRPTQEIIAPSDEGRLVDAVLVGRASELLREIKRVGKARALAIEAAPEALAPESLIDISAERVLDEPDEPDEPGKE